MAQSFMDKILRRARSATSDADLEQLKDEMEGKVPSDLMNKDNGGDMDDDKDNDGIHMHVHLPNNNGSDMPVAKDQGPDAPAELPGGDTPDLAARLATLEQKVAELAAMLDGDESEVELQNPGDAQDSKRYIMRRGSRLAKSHDEELMVPERLREMFGETDLPGIDDLSRPVETSRDSIPQEMIWQDTMTKGEIIVPGMRIPTFDSRIKPTITAQRLCSFRRQTLDAAFDNTEARGVLDGLVGIKTRDQVRTLACDTLKMAFEATANALASNRNNGIVRSSVVDSPQFRKSGPPSLGEIQRRNREAWKTGEFKGPAH